MCMDWPIDRLYLIKKKKKDVTWMTLLTTLVKTCQLEGTIIYFLQ